MLSSSINSNGIPPDLEFTLDEISTELAKLGVKETSLTRLAAIKADLDKMIAHDLDSLSINEGGDLKNKTNVVSSALTTSFSSDDCDSTLTYAEPTSRDKCIDQKLSDRMREEEMSAAEDYLEDTSIVPSPTDLVSSAEPLQRHCHSANSVQRKRWIHSYREDSGSNRRIKSSRSSRRPKSGRSTPPSRCSFGGQYGGPFTSASQYGDMPPVLEKPSSIGSPLESTPPENADCGRNSPGSASMSSRRLLLSGQRRGAGVKRGDPVSLWRLYKSQWERRARANATSERALRWSVKAAMAVREVPILNSSRRSLLYGPFTRN